MREANGTFAKGSSGNPNGRPRKKREERFLEITLSAVTYEDWKAIIKQAVQQAKRGNKDARRFLAEYLIGKPAQILEHTGAGGSAIIITGVDLTKEI